MPRRAYGLHKVGRYWHADFKVHGQHLHRSTGMTTFEDAEEVARLWHTDMQREAHGLPVDSRATCRDLFEAWGAWAEIHHSAAHVARVRSDWELFILPELGDVSAMAVTDTDAEALRTEFLSEGSQRNRQYGRPDGRPRTVAGANKISRHLRLVFRWAVSPGGLIPSVPFRVRQAREDEPRRHFLRRDQLPAFLGAVDRTGNLHQSVAVRLQLFLGLREGEALGLTWDAFTPDLSACMARRGKTGTAPRLPVHEELRVWLRKLPEPREGLVLPAEDGQPHRARYTVKAVERGGAAVGLHLSPHRLRGSYATLLAGAKAGAHTIRRALAHERLETSERYVAMGTDEIAEAQDRVFGAQHSHKTRKRYTLNMFIKKK